MSRIDNCNSALAGLPQTTIASLQRVQNAAARIQSSNSGRKSTLSQVYSSCVVTSEYAGGPSSNYICCIMHSISRGNYPEYLSSRRTAYCTICCCQPTAFRSSISIFCRLRVATHQVHRTCIFTRPSLAWNVLLKSSVPYQTSQISEDSSKFIILV